MDETRFRALMREAIGEEPTPPWLGGRVRSKLVAPIDRRPQARLFYLAAVALVALAVVGFGVTQLIANRSRFVVPAANPSPASTPSPVAVDPSGCKLPVWIQQGAEPPYTVQFGFIDTRTGLYEQDASASVTGLPTGFFGSEGVPDYYSPTLKRWLPVSGLQVSPDGRSYAWLQVLPVGSSQSNFRSVELHRYDVMTARDVTLWTSTVFIFVLRWDTDGIHVGTKPPRSLGSPGTSWLVDPVTGAVSQLPRPTSNFAFEPLPGDPHGTDGTSFHSIGIDAQGRAIWWYFNLDKPGAVDWVFYEVASGQRVYIYRGTQGDATGFYPDQAIADSTGIWFTDHNHIAVWHWRQDTGLTRIPIVGLPAGAINGLAGPCF